MLLPQRVEAAKQVTRRFRVIPVVAGVVNHHLVPEGSRKVASSIDEIVTGEKGVQPDASRAKRITSRRDRTRQPRLRDWAQLVCSFLRSGSLRKIRPLEESLYALRKFLHQIETCNHLSGLSHGSSIGQCGR